MESEGARSFSDRIFTLYSSLLDYDKPRLYGFAALSEFNIHSLEYRISPRPPRFTRYDPINAREFAIFRRPSRRRVIRSFASPVRTTAPTFSTNIDLASQAFSPIHGFLAEFAEAESAASCLIS